MPRSDSLSSSLIPRERLLQALADWQRHRLILVTAPAGFGKSTMAALWMQALRSDADAPHVAYVALDHTVTTAERLVELIGGEIAGFAPVMREVLTLGGAGVFTAQHVLATMCAEISRCGRAVLLVIDDVHLIDFEAGLAQLQYCIDHAPGNLHLLFLSRTRPRLHISRLQLAGAVLQLGFEDLAFDHAEFMQFVQQSRLNLLPSETLQYFETYTQGWVAGLQLLAHALPSTRGVPTSYFDDAVAAVNLWDYLESEILRQMPAELQGLLVESSVLPFLSTSLCAAALDHPIEEVRRLLAAAIARSGLIRQVASRESTGSEGRFRVHPVLRDYLRRRMNDDAAIDRVVQIRRRAAEWLAQHGEVDEALALLLDAGSLPADTQTQLDENQRLAAELIERSCRPALLQTELTAVRRWLSYLSPAVIQARPRLALDAAWAAYHMEHKDLRAVIQNAREAIESASAAGAEPADELRAELIALESNGAIGDGRFEDAYQIMKAASDLEIVPYGLASAYLSLGDAYVTDGGVRALETRLQSLNKAARIFEHIGFVRGRIEAFALESLVRRRVADTQGVLESSRHAVEYMEEKGWSRSNFGIVTLWTYGEELYFSGAVREGLEYLRRAERLLQDDATRAFSLYHLRIRAQLCRIVLGETVEIDPIVDALEWAEAVSKSKIITLASTAYLRILRDFRLGLPQRCRDTMRALSLSINDIAESSPYSITLSILAGEVLSGDAGDAVEPMLRRFRVHLQKNGMIRMGLQVQMLHVLRLQQMRRLDEALGELAELLTKLEESMLIRFALDFSVIQPLLEQIDTEFAYRIRSAMRITSRAGVDAGLEVSPVELRVLQLLDRGFDNRQIGLEMYVTYETVRSHLKSLYRKLGAHSSAEALRIAQDAGLV
jgi:LuxR family maltose regulon positive regulatory protein